tara:strand:- start:135 stop:386 length:252 start_codon:yes stop_codon:yes gene_type:complete
VINLAEVFKGLFMTTHLKLLRNTTLPETANDSVATVPLSDHVHVPAKPSLDMLTAGSSAGGVSVQKAWEIYMAMLRSAPSQYR